MEYAHGHACSHDETTRAARALIRLTHSTSSLDTRTTVESCLARPLHSTLWRCGVGMRHLTIAACVVIAVCHYRRSVCVVVAVCHSHTSVWGY